MFTLLAAMAEFEANLNRERTMAGLEVARKAGRTGGRTQRFTDEQILAAFAKARGNLTQAAKSMRYKVKGVTKTMTLQGFRKALERAQAAQSGDE